MNFRTPPLLELRGCPLGNPVCPNSTAPETGTDLLPEMMRQTAEPTKRSAYTGGVETRGGPLRPPPKLKRSPVTWPSPTGSRPRAADWGDQARQLNSLSPSQRNGRTSTGVSRSVVAAV